MTDLIRDVVFPSVAAMAVLLGMVTDAALADERPSRGPTATTAAVPPQATPKPAGVEPRCDRTGRIGKYHITRCD